MKRNTVNVEEITFRPLTDYITREQIEAMKVKDEIKFVSENGVRWRIKKTNESEKCFALYNLTNKVAICSRCKIDYLIATQVG